jgi:hypothetical protein
MAGMPNIVFVFADDMRFDAIAPLEHPQIRTPHVDRLVRTPSRLQLRQSTGFHLTSGGFGAIDFLEKW